MLNHRGFSAWITVGDEALPEYLVAVDDEAHRVSCWIPGDEGKVRILWPHNPISLLVAHMRAYAPPELYSVVDRPRG